MKHLSKETRKRIAKIRKIVPTLTDNFEMHTDLSGYSWIRVGGKATCVISPKSQDELANIVQALSANKIGYFPIGWGANTYFGNIFGAVLINMRGVTGIEVLREDRERLVVRVAGGTPLDNYARKYGYKGIDIAKILNERPTNDLMGFALNHDPSHIKGVIALARFTDIPGTMGGATAGNAGGNTEATGDLVTRVYLLNGNGRAKEWIADTMRFGYRYSILQSPDYRGTIISAVELDLKQADYDLVRTQVERRISERANMDESLSLGSFWKRRDSSYNMGTGGGQKFADEILKDYCHAGKVTRVGDMELSPSYPIMILNHGNGTLRDLEALAERVENWVAGCGNYYGSDGKPIQLKREVRKIQYGR